MLLFITSSLVCVSGVSASMIPDDWEERRRKFDEEFESTRSFVDTSGKIVIVLVVSGFIIILLCILASCYWSFIRRRRQTAMLGSSYTTYPPPLATVPHPQILPVQVHQNTGLANTAERETRPLVPFPPVPFDSAPTDRGVLSPSTPYPLGGGISSASRTDFELAEKETFDTKNSSDNPPSYFEVTHGGTNTPQNVVPVIRPTAPELPPSGCVEKTIDRW